jgi:hypothetical protein
MRIFVIVMYMIPLIITLLASGAVTRRQPALAVPIFFAALLPVVNMLTALIAVIATFMEVFYTKKPNDTSK